MYGFLISAIVMIVLVVFLWLFVRAMDGDRVSAAGAIFMIFLILGMLINSSNKKEAEGPCHEYETKMMYNTATKTMMPSRVCVLRGEWVGDAP